VLVPQARCWLNSCLQDEHVEFGVRSDAELLLSQSHQAMRCTDGFRTGLPLTSPADSTPSGLDAASAAVPAPNAEHAHSAGWVP